MIEVTWPGALTGAVLTPAESVDVARQVRQALIRARSEWRLRGGEVHVFMSAPAGLAVLVGQLLNTFGPVTAYEHVAERNAYEPAVTFATAPVANGI